MPLHHEIQTGSLGLAVLVLGCNDFINVRKIKVYNFMLIMTYTSELTKQIFLIIPQISHFFHDPKASVVYNDHDCIQRLIILTINELKHDMNEEIQYSRSNCAARSMDLRLTTSLRSLAMWSVMF